jgi:hypothetical protein
LCYIAGVDSEIKSALQKCAAGYSYVEETTQVDEDGREKRKRTVKHVAPNVGAIKLADKILTPEDDCPLEFMTKDELVVEWHRIGEMLENL